MILDLLPNQTLYRALHPGFAASFDWLARFDPQMADGQYSIDEDRILALVQSYITVPPAEKRFETHLERIDIQYIAQGTETIQIKPREALSVAEPYVAARDIVFYAEPPECTSLFCPAGSFAVFFPTDGHKPGCAGGAPTWVKKVVIKIKV